MKKLILSIAVLGIYLGAMAQCASSENIYRFDYEGKTYQVVKEKKSWADAAACSKELGGVLVEINNAEEQDKIFEEILNGAAVPDDYELIFNGGDIAYVWIGASDQAEEGTWIWDGDGDDEGVHFWSGEGANGEGNGSVVNSAYVNWGGSKSGTENEPDNYGTGQDHAAMGLTGWPSGNPVLGNPGEWNDITGTSKIYFVVEHPYILGIEKEPGEGSIQKARVYPNPASDLLYIDIEDVSGIEIFDMSGKLVDSFEHAPVPIHNLPVGSYLVKVSSPDGIIRQKVLIK